MWVYLKMNGLPTDDNSPYKNILPFDFAVSDMNFPAWLKTILSQSQLLQPSLEDELIRCLYEQVTLTHKV